VKGSFVVVAILGALAAGCEGHSEKSLSGTGSTFIAPLMSRWQGEYGGRGKVSYESVGSVVGVQRLAGGVFDFACTDAPLGEEQLARLKKANGEVIHVPLVLGAVVPAYNLDGVTDPLTFSGPVLADIYLGKITRWDDPALKELNPGVSLPAKEVAVIHRDDGSGTSYVWTDYLAKVSPEWKAKVGVGVSVNWPAGTGASGNEGTATKVKKTPGALAFLPLAYASKDDVKTGLVKNREGVAVKASSESVTAAASAAPGAIPDDLRYSLTDAPGKDSYPISGTTWAVVVEKQPSEKGRALVAFLRWATHEGQDHVAELGYAPLPAGLVQRVETALTRVGAGKP
jgi:phosphate transport system substrate-binding protein